MRDSDKLRKQRIESFNIELMQVIWSHFEGYETLNAPWNLSNVQVEKKFFFQLLSVPVENFFLLFVIIFSAKNFQKWP